LTTLGFQIKDVADNLPFPDWYLSAVTAFFFISLGVNALVTALIVYRIITVYNDIRGFNVQASMHGNGQRDLYPLISILIESGLITFVGQLAQSIMYKSAGFAFPLVGGCVVMLYVRASCRLLIWSFNSSTYYIGNFDDRCPCACRNGRFLRSKYIKDNEFNELGAPIRLEGQSDHRD
jgi:hypothetical protein